ncbi:RagB/SusD family nutrient uptake outer membrane protein [Chitinophaga filiformis]|uniref:SusD family protein n=1 Tax=Chitinophaga filiformis TaxID=104663 RepID=A0A1G7MF90_CHIFI|nr:RagB/SusD family nutrient uptake outer membrane protein [Chitinophaga filiformis]SDF60387.1 SusD family protein [Chitinophaga filiformis]
MNTIYKCSRNAIMAVLLFCLFPLHGCKKFVEVEPPPTNVNEGNVYAYGSTAAAAMIGIYTQMSNSFFLRDISLYAELSADNLVLFNNDKTDYVTYYQNALLATNDGTTKFWLQIYPYIFSVNSAIEGLNKSNGVTSTVKQHLLGEAHFLRAFYYFYLVNSYGDVPLALSTDYVVNNSLSRSPASLVVAQIIDDLKQAQNLLSDSYLQADAATAFPTGQEERIKPNRSAASALLARVYLYQKDWVNAELAASEVINKTALYSAIPLDQVFLKNSKETIWSIPGVRAGSPNTDIGDIFILRPGGPADVTDRTIYLSQKLVDLFQTGDQRKNVWVNSVTDNNNKPYPYAAKYKATGGDALSEYMIILRLGEQYLIRAEARLQLGRTQDAIADLNTLRARSIDPNEPDENKRLKLLATSLSKEAALTALNYERRVEMFCEWGDRWFDLKRSGQIDAVMSAAAPLKGGVAWQSYKAWYPVPSDEIRINTKLSQNTGYN